MAVTTITLSNAGNLKRQVANQVTIEELAGARRLITLRGTGLPHVGASWGVKQNAPVTWFPGNPEGSQQVLGGQVLPGDWEGTWKRTLLGRSPCYVGSNGEQGVSVVEPATLVKVFESMCLAGVRVRVKWRDLVREGRITQFDHAHGKTTDVAWKAHFDWVNRGRKVDKRVQGVRNGSLTSEIDAGVVEAELAANMEPTRLMVGGRTTLPKGAPKLTLGQLGALLNAPNKMLSNFCRQCRSFGKNLQQAGALVIQARNIPASLQNTVLNETENMLALCNTTADALSRESPEMLAVKRNAADVTRNASYFGSGIRQSQVLAKKCQDIRFTVNRTKGEALGTGTGDNRDAPQSAAVLTVHAVKQGETLVSISHRHYGTPDHAYDIAVANHLGYPCPPDSGGHSIGGRRTLIIPVLSGQGSGV